jgi:bifunctional UDP-N-acetylglucosamine pyrophosphorylase/glucosamine-1-phosphate N-acetyltransferase
MQSECRAKVQQLIEKGVKIPLPEAVFVGDEVRPEQVAANGVFLYPGCRIFGERTLVMAGAKLGREGPVTVENCQIGPDVELAGGYFRGSVFLEKAKVGHGAHVRDGCILEEEASCAHTVGLKQTILFPFVTLGSLINFCDCLMAGGTSRTNHSEVGSSYIHFNYTPNQDKATPSLLGDVPRGVMLNQSPIFLGGQGGLVGPLRIEYGTVIAAGVVCRKDACEEGKLVLGHGPLDRAVNFHPGLYWYVKRQVVNNSRYIANLVALRHWYLMVRSLFLGGDSMGRMLHESLLEKLDLVFEERIRRFQALSEKMPESAEKYRSLMTNRASARLLRQKEEFAGRWQDLEAVFRTSLQSPGEPALFEPFLERVEEQKRKKGRGFVSVVQGLDSSWSLKGTAWLQGIVGGVEQQVMDLMPSFSEK